MQCSVDAQILKQRCRKDNETIFHIGTVPCSEDESQHSKALISFGRRVKFLINVNISSVIIK